MKVRATIILLLLYWNALAQDMTNNGGTLTIMQGAVVTVPGNVTNNGTITNNGNIALGGQWLNNATYIEGTGTLTLSVNGDQVVNHNAQSFSRLRISGGGIKIFEADITIEDELILDDGITCIR